MAMPYCSCNRSKYSSSNYSSFPNSLHFFFIYASSISHSILPYHCLGAPCSKFLVHHKILSLWGREQWLHSPAFKSDATVASFGNPLWNPLVAPSALAIISINLLGYMGDPCLMCATKVIRLQWNYPDDPRTPGPPQIRLFVIGLIVPSLALVTPPSSGWIWSTALCKKIRIASEHQQTMHYDGEPCTVNGPKLA